MSRIKVTTYCLLAALSSVSMLPANAAESSGQFNVTVHLQSTNDNGTGGNGTGGNTAGNNASGICIKSMGQDTMGAVVRVACATGTVIDIQTPKGAVSWMPIHGGAYRFTRLSEIEMSGAEIFESTESYHGVGTVTSWRMVNLADRDYLELLIGW